MSIFSWFGQGKTAAEPSTSAASHTSQPAVTPEGAAHGFEWEMPTQSHNDAVLWPDASIAMEVGPLAVISRDKGWNLDTGSDNRQTKHLLRNNAMRKAEALGVQWVEKKGRFAAREGRGAPRNRDTQETDLDLDR